MGTVTIRNLDDVMIEALKRRAKAGRRSLEGEVREILARAAAACDAEDIVREVRTIHDRILARHGGRPLATDSADLLRDERERL